MDENIDVFDKNGAIVTQLGPTNFKQIEFDYQILLNGFSSISGFIKKNNIAIGEFINDGINFNKTYYILESNKPFIKEGDDLVFEITNPTSFSKTIPLLRNQNDFYDTFSYAQRISYINRNEWEGNIFDNFSLFNNALISINETAEFDYTKNFEKLRIYMLDLERLPEGTSLIYDNSSEADFSLGATYNLVTDATSNKTNVLMPDGSWKEVSTPPQTVFSYPRIILNPETGNEYYVGQNVLNLYWGDISTIEVIANPYNETSTVTFTILNFDSTKNYSMTTDIGNINYSGGDTFDLNVPNNFSGEFANINVSNNTDSISFQYRLVYNSIILQDKEFDVITTKTTLIPVSNILSGSIDEWSGGNDPLTLISVQNPLRGTVTLNGSNVEFTSTGSVGNPASFEYTVRNSIGKEKVGTVDMNVVPIPPIITNADLFDLQQGESLLISKSQLVINDVDGQGQTLSVSSVSNPTNGTLSSSGNNITFTSTGLSSEPAGFQYTATNGTEQQTGDVFVNITPLPEREFLLYQTTTEAQNAKNTLTPASVQDIFNDWGRFNGNTFYQDKNAAQAANDSNATAWQFLTNPDRVSMPLNVSPANGFVSNEDIENYTFEVTLTSTDNDNDTIGVIIAFKREGSTNHILSLLTSSGGTTPLNGYALAYHTGDELQFGDLNRGYLRTSNYLSTSGGWSNDKVRVRVERQGDSIKCLGTNINDTNNFQTVSELNFDLNTDNNTQRFKGPKPYGYITFSQPDTTYLDISFRGGAVRDKIYDMQSGDVFEFVNGSWVNKSVTINDDIGFIRKVVNPETNKRFIVKQSTIEYLGKLTSNFNLNSNRISNENQIVVINSVNNSSGANQNVQLVGLYENQKEESNLLKNKPKPTTQSNYNGSYNRFNSANWFSDNGIDINTLDLQGGTVVFSNGIVGKINSVSDGTGSINESHIFYDPTTDFDLYDKTL